MNLKQIELFLSVVESKSFTEAAKKNFLTQPTVSSQINSLEKSLNCKLFVRNTKEVILTENAEKLLPLAKKLINDRDAIEKAFYQDKKTKNEIIAIAASTVPSKHILPEILSAYIKVDNEISFKVWEGDSTDVEALISQGKYQIGFTGTKENYSLCKYSPFFEDELVVITPNTKKYQEMKEKISIEEVLSSPLIFREEGSGTRIEVEKHIKSMGYNAERLNIIASFTSQEAIINSVASNMGISILSKITVLDDVKNKKILMFKFPSKAFKRNLYAVTSNEYTLNSKEKKFLKFVKQYIQEKNIK